MDTFANRTGLSFASALDAEGNTRDLIEGTPPVASSGTWTDGVGRFGYGAYLFNAANKYVSYANDSRFILGGGTQNFHIGAWVKLTATNTYATLCECDPNTTGRRFSFRVRNGGNSPLFYMAPSYPDVSPTALVVSGPASMGTTGVWKYVCCQRVGNVYTVYVDGVAGTPVTYTASDFVLPTTRAFTIGHFVGGNSSFALYGYVQGFQISEPGTLLDVYGGKRPIR